MKIVDCEYDRHGETILKIFNQAIASSTALYEYEPRTIKDIKQWFQAKNQRKYPIIGIQDNQGDLLGFASYGSFRSFAAFQYSIEHSVYVDAAHRNKGAGKTLLKQLIQIGQQQNYHMMIGVIDGTNQISIKLHQSLDFNYCGTIKHAGFKFNRWLDIELYQLILNDASNTEDKRNADIFTS